MRVIAFTTMAVLSSVLVADDTELSLFLAVGPGQQTHSLETRDHFVAGLRAGRLVLKEERYRLRVEGTLTGRNTSGLNSLIPGSSFLGSRTIQWCSLSLLGETWIHPYWCLLGSVEGRMNRTEIQTVNHLGQAWVKVGFGGRFWPMIPDLDPTTKWYPFIRVDYGIAISPKGHGISAELLPRKEFTLSWGVRF